MILPAVGIVVGFILGSEYNPNNIITQFRKAEREKTAGRNDSGWNCAGAGSHGESGGAASSAFDRD